MVNGHFEPMECRLSAAQSYMTLGGIGSAQRSAVAGLSHASTLLERSASTIATESTRGPASTLHLSDEARALAAGLGQADASHASVVGAITDLSLAEHLNAANVKVLQTAEQMLDVAAGLIGKQKP